MLWINCFLLRVPMFRDVAMKGLRGTKDARAVEALSRLLTHRNSRVRHYAVWYLALVGHPSAVDPIVNSIKDPSSEVRLAAAEQLAKIADPRAAIPLVEALREAGTADPWIDPSSARVSIPAAKALIALGSRAVPALLKLLSDPHFMVRCEAINALAAIGDPEAAESVGCLMCDTLEPVRYDATVALGKFGTAPCISRLIAALSDDSNRVRFAAARALGDLRAAEALEALRGNLDDPVSNSREAARLAIAKIVGEDDGPAEPSAPADAEKPHR